MFTRFWDMCSGGWRKEKFALCFIEGSKDVAKKIFEDMFNHDPCNITCECCGSDYNVDEFKNITQATAFHRNCRYDHKKKKYVADTGAKDYVLLKDFLKRKDVFVIKKITKDA